MTLLQFPSDCEIRHNERLADYCTLRVGGPVAFSVFPETVTALVRCVDTCLSSQRPFRVIGNGSNVLCTDDGYDGVLLVTDRCRSLSVERNTVEATCGVPLHQLIKCLLHNSLGGIEYLVSVPGTVAGAVFNNAGRGEAFNCYIGQCIDSVTVFNGETVVRLSRDECAFAHRHSLFQDYPLWVILSARFLFQPQSYASGSALIRSRMQHVNKVQDRSYPNAGSVFKRGYRLDLKGYRIGGARFSRKTANWIVNDGNATARDIEGLIAFAIGEHLRHGLPSPELEWQRIPNDV